MAATSEQNLETLRKDFDSLKSDVKDLSSAVKELFKDEANLARDRARKAGRQVGQKIEEHPAASVGTAMGIGFIIGMLVDRQFRR